MTVSPPSPQEWLHSVVFDPAFLQKYRYYAYVLAQLRVVADPYVPVMAVSRQGLKLFLHVNVEFFTKSPQYVWGVLLHEVHHVVLGHLTDERFQNSRHPDLMVMAKEMSANEFIREPLPGQPVTWEQYAGFGVSSRQSTLERYERLVAARESGAEIDAVRPLDSHDWELTDSAQSGPLSNSSVQQLLEAALRAIESLPKPEDANAGGLLAGRSPGDWLQSLSGTSSPPQVPVNWKQVLRKFVAPVQRTPVPTWSRPNRRFRDRLGQVPGRQYRRRRDDLGHLLVAIDTSGSMGLGDLDEIGRQLRRMHDLVRITIVECDASIQRVYEFDGRLENVRGRGGTDFRPVFEREFLLRHRPQGIVYFTDGGGRWPANDPGVPTLWVLTRPIEFTCPWGDKVAMRLPGSSECPVYDFPPLIWTVGGDPQGQ